MILADATTWGMGRLGAVTLQEDLFTGLDSRAEEEPAAIPGLPTDWQVARTWARSRLPADVMTLEISDLGAPDRTLNAITAEDRFPLADRPLVVIAGGRVSWNAEARANVPSYARRNAPTSRTRHV
jgi:hypothetical protein